MKRLRSLFLFALAATAAAIADAQTTANEYYFTKRNSANTANQQVKVTPAEGKGIKFNSSLEPIVFTVGTAASVDVPATGDASSSQAVLGNDSRLSDARTPTTHTHTAADISDATTFTRGFLAALSAAEARTLLELGNSATRAVGTTAGTVAAGDDSRITGAVQTTRTISTTGPLSGGGDLSANRTLTIADAAADGATKGAATFLAADFNALSGLISLDYTNAQKASGSQHGFLSSTDWTTFNNKLATNGNGSNLTSLNASELTTGTVPSERLPKIESIWGDDGEAPAAPRAQMRGGSGYGVELYDPSIEAWAPLRYSENQWSFGTHTSPDALVFYVGEAPTTLYFDSASSNVGYFFPGTSGSYYVLATKSLNVGTTSATTTTVATVPVPANTTLGCVVYLTARRTGGTAGAAHDGAFYEIKLVAKGQAGTNAALIGSPLITVIGESQSGWDVTVTTSGGNVLIQVIGAADNNVTWTARLLEFERS